ncbi:hypothetical protein LTS18_010155 [Coniosporium uncinatum]|uniref:Uncharacterized protein n=1 Tax=Coniosporium uncinatum TaxID=93489 RepID=A0ACC3D9T0_9PEZI|nr:hypothetical protein LTS18_010155 [Coniosporium uncinatum]
MSAGGKRLSTGDASKTLNKSLESRRSSSTSKKSLLGHTVAKPASSEALAEEANGSPDLKPPPANTSSTPEGKHDQEAGRRSASPSKSLLPIISPPGPACASPSKPVNISPSKSVRSLVPAPSPSKQPGKKTSFWQFDLSLERKPSH